MSRTGPALRDDDRALLAAALEAHARGRFEAGLAHCEAVLARRRDQPDALWLKGVLLHRTGRSEEAVKALRRACLKAPERAQFHDALALALRALGRDREALAALDRALAIEPGYVFALINRAGVLFDLGRLDAAAAACEAALAAGPRDARAWNNLGTLLRALGRTGAAAEAYRAALRLAPGYAEARANLGHIALLSGRYEEGFRDYEARLARPELAAQMARFAAIPAWDGRPLAGATVLLHAEQGLGDTLQFARYIPMVAARCGRVVVACQPALAPLIERIAGVARVVPLEAPPPAAAAQAPLMSLPRLFATRLDSIPAEVPYLSPPPGPLPPPLERPPEGLRVGVAWAGNPRNPTDRHRSCPARAFAALAEVPGVTLYSLQVGPRAAEIVEIPGAVDLAPWLGDFGATARALERLDLVVSVCTSVAHLAGALARPLWLALCFSADWRWLEERDDSPWYPTARLFRQSAPGDWEGVFARLRAALAERTG